MVSFDATNYLNICQTGHARVLAGMVDGNAFDGPHRAMIGSNTPPLSRNAVNELEATSNGYSSRRGGGLSGSSSQWVIANRARTRKPQAVTWSDRVTG